MAIIKVTKASSVQSIQRQFKNEFNCNIRIYKGNIFAEQKIKINELSKKDNPGGELNVGPRSRVENVERYFMETFGIKVQVSNSDNTKLADNSLTLSQASKL